MSARMLMTTGGGLVVRIDQAVRYPNVRALALAAGWDGASPFTLQIDEGVDVANLRIVTSGSIADPIPHDVLTVLNFGRIGGLWSDPDNAGASPTRGIYTTSRIKIDNQGEIFGAGSPGSYGADASCYYWSATQGNQIISYGGKGGAGQGFNSYSPLTGKTIPMTNNGSGFEATQVTYSGPTSGGAPAFCKGGTGGDGGLKGQRGGRGQTNTTFGGTYVSPSTGSVQEPRPSVAVQGASLVTWINQGLILGELS